MLNLRNVALQGLGFKLTPIALAVQGLIDELQEEERQQQYGGRGRRGRAQVTQRQAAEQRRPAPRDELTYEEVAARWELLDMQLAAQVRPAALPAPVLASPAAAATHVQAPPAAPAPDTSAQLQREAEQLAAAELLRAQLERDEAVALILLLSEA